MNVDRRYRHVYQPLLCAAALAPLALLVAEGLGVGALSLGPDPVKHVLHTLGKTSLNLLLLTLLVTPVRQIFRRPQLLRLRRTLGLFAFGYVVLHFAVYLALELQLDFSALAADIAKRPYITIGFAALLLLVPLAATSTQRMMRRLGKRWQTLHYLVYPAAILGVWHYWWQVKADIREPLLYASMLAALLGYRLWRRRATWMSGSATAPGRT